MSTVFKILEDKYGDGKKKSRYPKGEIHPFEIKTGVWRNGHSDYFEIVGASYPVVDGDDNLCDSCDNYSDYFVRGNVSTLRRGRYDNTRVGPIRLCNDCIIETWFRVLFHMRVPRLSKY